jgi:hypothetical protein
MSGGRTFFTSPPFAITSCLSPLPGGRSRYVQHSIDVSPEATMPIAFALDELDEALLLQEVQVALDSPRASGEPPRQGLHAGPAEAVFVV